MVKFVNFGCWGDYNNKIYGNPWLSNVIKKINNEIEKIDFFIVNGDNYYQQKIKNGESKKSKKIDIEELKKGFDKLFEVLNNDDQELYLVLGNHDLEYINKACETTTTEKEIVEKYNNRGIIHIPNNLTMFKEFDNNIIIMIDTNIYANIKKNCYKEINDSFDDNYDFINYQKELIIKRLNEKMYKNIIVCGHHPIFGIKNQLIKEGKRKGGIEILSREIYDLFFDVINGHAENYHYLCSDIHNYQKGKVTIIEGDKQIEINQYIIGTGGAKLDDDYNEKYDENFNSDNNNDNVCSIDAKIDNIELNYKIHEHSSQYGYIVVEIDNNKIQIKPILIQNIPIKKCGSDSKMSVKSLVKPKKYIKSNKSNRKTMKKVYSLSRRSQSSYRSRPKSI